MKLKAEIMIEQIPMFKKIISDLKRISPANPVIFMFTDSDLIIHNYGSADNIEGLIFFIKFEASLCFSTYICQSKKPNNLIAFKMLEDFSKFAVSFNKIEDSAPTTLLLAKEEKRYIKIKYEAPNGLYAVENNNEVDLIFDALPSPPSMDKKLIEIILPLRELADFLDEANSRQDSVVFKIFNVNVGERHASFSLKLSNAKYKVTYSELILVEQNLSVPPHSFVYEHMISSKTVKQLSAACAGAEFGVLILYEGGYLCLLSSHFQTVGDSECLLKCQQRILIPCLRNNDNSLE